MRYLDELLPGETATVSGIVRFPLEPRLRDIGLCDGDEVKCVFSSPFGDPCAYEICGAVIALRHTDAHRICVTKGGARA